MDRLDRARCGNVFNCGVEMVNGASAREIRSYFSRGRGCKSHAEYGDRRCKCWNKLFYFEIELR